MKEGGQTALQLNPEFLRLYVDLWEELEMLTLFLGIFSSFAEMAEKPPPTGAVSRMAKESANKILVVLKLRDHKRFLESSTPSYLQGSNRVENRTLGMHLIIAAVSINVGFLCLFG
ncbi:hypothetical protein JTB14_015919 [Gonioctena quinquepunctata]|nr:hypothetical protein JTB14_015919 [Gonioctena quinquepunctata]